MVFNKWCNGVPVAFVVIQQSKEADISPWLGALRVKLVLKMPQWRPDAFIVNDAQAEINALKFVSDAAIPLLLDSISPAIWYVYSPRSIDQTLTFVLLLSCRQAFPHIYVFLYLWHVRRAWQKNAYLRIEGVTTHAWALQELGTLMYIEESPIPTMTVNQYVQMQFKMLKMLVTSAQAFWAYVKK